MFQHVKRYVVAYLAFLLFLGLFFLSVYNPSFEKESLVLGGAFCSNLLILQGFISLDRRQEESLNAAMKREEYKIETENRIKAIEELNCAQQLKVGDDDMYKEIAGKLLLAISRIVAYQLLNDHAENFKNHTTRVGFEYYNHKRLTLGMIIENCAFYSPSKKYVCEKEALEKQPITIYSLINAMRHVLMDEEVNELNVKDIKNGCSILIFLLSVRYNLT
ncbi:hypothetical protein C0W44_11400 [Photobacterium leiognathi subsp. mandapamensis]|nr:hypothetical protein C0W44_11400 [Photobacterium leiognathi subsp. mandapamensis]